MQTPPVDLRALANAGMEALRGGDAGHARFLFEQVTASGRADASVWLGLAYACAGLNDGPGMLAAADRALELQPRNPRALILKGDWFAEAGDARAASAFYRSALAAAPPPDQLAADLALEVRRAQAAVDRYAEAYEAHIRGRLAAQGFADGAASRRFAQSVDLMTGRKQLYLQQPRFYYFPELPQRQFYDRAEFPWLDVVEAATADIREELQAVLEEEGAFTPYVEADPNRPAADPHRMRGNPNWSAFFLWKNGAPVSENAARCPKTLAALDGAPLARVEGRTPSILFSLLRPGARIPPHNGFVNTRLICHLPLIAPDGCRFRVGNDVRPWIEGKAWVFDDTIEHEAWNDSRHTRVILLFDIWRPELTEEERRLVADLFAAVDAYSGERVEWTA